jgi:membrane protease YdiL (CAAX protease family)
MVIYELAWWLLALAILFIVRQEGTSLASVGVRRPNAATYLIAAAVAAVLVLLFPTIEGVLSLFGIAGSTPTLDRLSRLPPWLIFLGTIRAGVTEELLFRGYLIERLTFLTGRKGYASIISLEIFVLLHLGSWPPGHLIYVAIAGGALTLLYVRRRDLICNIVAHVLTDSAAFLAAAFV